jgi:hypothetical protein
MEPGDLAALLSNPFYAIQIDPVLAEATRASR